MTDTKSDDEAKPARTKRATPAKSAKSKSTAAKSGKPAAKAKPAAKSKSAGKSAESNALWVKAGLGAAAIGSAAIAAAVLYTRKPKDEAKPKPAMPEPGSD